MASGNVVREFKPFTEKTFEKGHRDQVFTVAFTKDGQLDPKIAAERDALYSVSMAAKKNARADIPDAKLDPGADAWQKGAAVQLDLKTVSSTTR